MRCCSYQHNKNKIPTLWEPLAPEIVTYFNLNLKFSNKNNSIANQITYI